MSIRVATADDAPGILECLRAAFEPYRSLYTPDAYVDTTLTPETLKQRLMSMTVLVAQSHNDVIGTIAFHDSPSGEGHLRGMAVLPGWQGRGVAASLLAEAERRLRALRCTRITLDTTEPLRRAVRFYEKHGFEHTGRVTDFFGMPLFEYAKELRANESAS
jgi:ribosomal protein S18 acetylase RimI-like enzyme